MYLALAASFACEANAANFVCSIGAEYSQAADGSLSQNKLTEIFKGKTFTADTSTGDVKGDYIPANGRFEVVGAGNASDSALLVIKGSPAHHAPGMVVGPYPFLYALYINVFEPAPHPFKFVGSVEIVTGTCKPASY
jgi:hypothetical protein